MKKILLEILAFTTALCLLFAFCFSCARTVGETIDEVEELLKNTPDAARFQSVLASGGDRAGLSEELERIERTLFDAEKRVSFLVNYEYLSRACAAASALSAAARGSEPGLYAQARAALAEALESLRREGDLTLELFF